MKTYNLDSKKIKELGIILNKKRLNKNISISQLASKLEVNAGYITKLEKGSNSKSINVLLLKTICKELDLNYYDLLKKIGYLDKETFILSVENIKKIFLIGENLEKELGNEHPLTKEYLDCFSKEFSNSLEKNITIFENLEDFNPKSSKSEFKINSFIFKNIELKAFFKKETKGEIKDGSYVLVKLKNKYCLKKYYLEKEKQVILLNPLDKEKPLIIDLDSLDYYGTLYQTIKKDLY